jgi:hypothetical protein
MENLEENPETENLEENLEKIRYFLKSFDTFRDQNFA